MMMGAGAAYVALLFLTWSLPGGDPLAQHLAYPDDTKLVVEVMEFDNRSSCEAFLDAVRDQGDDALPYDNTTLSHAECRRL